MLIQFISLNYQFLYLLKLFDCYNSLVIKFTPKVFFFSKSGNDTF